MRKLENISRSEARLLPVLLVLLISVGCGEEARFRLWAQLGSADSQFEYGMLLVPSEPREAIRWLEKAAAQGHLNAVLELVEVYRGERGLPGKPELATAWYQKAAERGHVQSQLTLARRLAAGIGAPVNHGRAAKLFEAAADAGNADAQYELG